MITSSNGAVFKLRQMERHPLIPIQFLAERAIHPIERHGPLLVIACHVVQLSPSTQYAIAARMVPSRNAIR